MPRYERKGESSKRGSVSFHAARTRRKGKNRGELHTEFRSGYYAIIDSKGRWVDVPDVHIMTYNELYEKCRQGYLSKGTLLEQADMQGRHIGYFKLHFNGSREPRLELVDLGCYQIPLLALAGD